MLFFLVRFYLLHLTCLCYSAISCSIGSLLLSQMCSHFLNRIYYTLLWSLSCLISVCNTLCFLRFLSASFVYFQCKTHDLRFLRICIEIVKRHTFVLATRKSMMSWRDGYKEVTEVRKQDVMKIRREKTHVRFTERGNKKWTKENRQNDSMQFNPVVVYMIRINPQPLHVSVSFVDERHLRRFGGVSGWTINSVASHVSHKYSLYVSVDISYGIVIRLIHSWHTNIHHSELRFHRLRLSFGHILDRFGRWVGNENKCRQINRSFGFYN